MKVIDLSDEDREQIFLACAIIEKVLEKYGDLSIDSFIDDKKHNSLIRVSYSNNRKLSHENP